MDDLHNEIFNKTDYIALHSSIQSTNFLKRLIERWGIPSIIEEVATVLKSENEEEIFIVSLILRDACMKKAEAPDFDRVVIQFRETLEKSEIFELMNRNLYSKDRLVRETTYITFGKIAFSQNATYLKGAFGYYKEHFPDQLERLLFEYNWLIHVD